MLECHSPKSLAGLIFAQGLLVNAIHRVCLLFAISINFLSLCHFLFFLKNYFYQSIVDLKCVSFCCAAMIFKFYLFLYPNLEVPGPLFIKLGTIEWDEWTPGTEWGGVDSWWQLSQEASPCWPGGLRRAVRAIGQSFCLVHTHPITTVGAGEGQLCVPDKHRCLSCLNLKKYPSLLPLHLCQK